MLLLFRANWYGPPQVKFLGRDRSLSKEKTGPKQRAEIEKLGFGAVFILIMSRLNGCALHDELEVALGLVAGEAHPPHHVMTAGSPRTSSRLRASRPQATATRWTACPRYLSA